MPHCVIRGKLPAVFGRYRFTTKEQSLPIKRPVTRTISPQGISESDHLDIQSLRAMATLPEIAAVMLGVEQLPVEIKAPFVFAGKRFEQELEQYCDMFIFTRQLETTWGKGEKGFELFMAEASSREILELSDSMRTEEGEPGGDLRKFMFLNLYDENRRPLEGARLHWIMSRLLGRMMFPVLLEKNYKLSAKSLSPHAWDHFAYSYHYQVTAGIFEYLKQKPEFAKSPDRQYYESKIDKIADRINTLYNLLPHDEQELILDLL